MADLRLITVPYHNGRRYLGRGLGPAHLASDVAVTACEPQADRDGWMRLAAHRLLGEIGTLAMRHYRR